MIYSVLGVWISSFYICMYEFTVLRGRPLLRHEYISLICNLFFLSYPILSSLPTQFELNTELDNLWPIPMQTAFHPPIIKQQFSVCALSFSIQPRPAVHMLIGARKLNCRNDQHGVFSAFVELRDENSIDGPFNTYHFQVPYVSFYSLTRSSGSVPSASVFGDGVHFEIHCLRLYLGFVRCFGNATDHRKTFYYYCWGFMNL